jgi:dihydrofolate reductase
MRRIINSTYITLDGVIENPKDWPSGRHEDGGRGTEIQTELVVGCDALLLGRRTYEGFVPVWTAMSGDPMSDQMNAMEKWIVSSTLTDPTWNNTEVVGGDVAAEIARRRPTGCSTNCGCGSIRSCWARAIQATWRSAPSAPVTSSWPTARR